VRFYPCSVLIFVSPSKCRKNPKLTNIVIGATVESGASTLILDVEREVMIDRASVLTHVSMNMIDKQ
jgi:hypothetical protein